MNTHIKKAAKLLIIAVAALMCAFALYGCSDSLSKDTASDIGVDSASGSDNNMESAHTNEPSFSEELIEVISRTADTVIDGSYPAFPIPTVSNHSDNKSSKYYIMVYKGSQSTVVYGKDSDGNYTKQVKIFTCSTGAKSSDTPVGGYKIRAKYRWRYLVGGVLGQYNSSISEYYLFHSVPYYKMDASTLEDEEYDKLGSPASQGCIRMCVRDCKWIYDNCPVGTQVSIVDDVGPKGPGVPHRSKNPVFNGWDPSDKWSTGNPYFNRATS